MSKEIIDKFTQKWQRGADIEDDAFWKDCINTYRSINQYRLTLPWLDSPETRQQAANLLHCKKPCSECCQFGLESISYKDAVRIVDGVKIAWKQLGEVCSLIQRNGCNEMWAIKGIPCPFLKDELCSIYEFRPEVCRRYPILSPTQINGTKRLAVSIRCDSGAGVGREMIRLHLKLAGGELTPNLLVIPS